MLKQLLCGLVCAAMWVGCNEAAPPVNRVQPNVVEKSAFEGEWYYLQTVVDTPYSAAYTFVGEQSLLEKIEWEIQEDLLIARRSYEFVTGADSAGITERPERGAPVAIYAIESHFDIRREYDAVTGEERNVIEENSTDRPWNEREHMRVDWSRNLISEAEFLVIARLFDGIEAEPVAYFVQGDHPDAPQFVTGEDGTVEYIDVVNKMFVEPTMVEIEGWGSWPSCWLLYQTHVDCAPTELAVRHSFLRVDPDRDYQPLDYSGDRMDRFGYFVSERPGYDPHYGLVEPARHHWVNRHDLWTASHRRDDAGEWLSCATDAECDDGRGSVCDRDFGIARQLDHGVCTIPYRDREARTIAYHASERFPVDLLHDARHVASEWNRAFVETVGSMREQECLAHGGDAGSCSGERDRDDARDMFVLCENPVAESDHEACGEPGTIAKIGDLRYNLLAWVPEAHTASPLGYGPSAADPETGELIQANAFVYGAEVEELSTYARDLVAVLAGDLSASEVMDGAHVERWVEGIRAREASAGREADHHAIRIDGAEAPRIAGAMGLDRLGTRRTSRPRSSRPASRAEMVARATAATRALRDGDVLPRDDGRARARADALRDTPIEALLTGPELLAAHGIDPRRPATSGALDIASPLRGASLAERRALDHARRRIQRDRCVLQADFADDGLLGLARAITRAVEEGDGTMTWYGQAYPIRLEDGSVDWEAVRTMLRHPIFDAVMAHEIGHTLGLRHNFSGSYDSLNYPADYWALRDDGRMQPRAWDPLTEAEIDGRIRELQYSTVMDYGNNFVVTDAAGIGYYDVAAIKMGYGDLVEVFENADDPSEMAWVAYMQQNGWPVPVKTESFYSGSEVTAYAYTDIPGLLGGVDRLSQRADVPYTSLVADDALAADGIDAPLVDSEGRPAVPYRFCSDETVDLGPDCMTYDAGADPYETLQSVIDTYWDYYVFAAFRRERLGFDVDGYFARIYDRYFSKIQSANQVYVLDYSWLSEIFWGDPSLDAFFTRPDGMGAHTLGAGAGFSLLTRVVGAPEPGEYTTYARADGTEAMYLDWYATSPELVVGVGDGRYLETTWNWDAGYYWFDQLERAGFFYDKILAVMTLTDPETWFVGKDTASDLRGYALSFHTTFPEPLEGFLSGVLADDWTGWAPRARGGELVYPLPDDLAAGAMTGTPIDPNAGFSVQVYAAVWSMLLLPLGYDHTFMEQARIFVRGGAEGVELPVGETVEFLDPTTGLTYVAASWPDETGRETGLGARMLLHAQALADAGELGELDDFMDVVTLMRTLTWELGFGI